MTALINIQKTLLLSLVFLISVAWSCIAQPKNLFQQKIFIIMLDGFGEDYYRNSDMPVLNKMEKEGLFKVVPSLMPAVTNVNNVAIATGQSPLINGITGNMYFNQQKGTEEYIESPDLVLSPTIFQKAKEAGAKSALFSSKKKTIDILGKDADITLCPECSTISDAPSVYSKEVSYWLFEAAIKTVKEDDSLKLIYIHTTDYPMHTWPPESQDSKDFLNRLDAYIGRLIALDPKATVLITADHGMHHKNRAYDIATVCANKNTPVKIVISPEKDRYMKHHKGLGGSAYVYLNSMSDSSAVKKTLLSIPGVKRVLTREEASKTYLLMPEKIGDFMVTGDINTVFGDLNGNESEELDINYRSHGSDYEAKVPLFIYRAQNPPPSTYFDWNYKLTTWLWD